MASKTFSTRVKTKRDTSANWTSKDPVLLDGEIIIVDTASGETRFKIGDGTKKYSQLPFQDETVRTLIDAKATKDVVTTSANGLMSSADKTKLNNIEEGANKTIVDSSLSSTSINPVQNKIIQNEISIIKTDLGDINVIGDIDADVCNAILQVNNAKVDKVYGKGLSTNDYTTAEKNKLSEIEEGANKTVVDTSLETTSTNPVQNKAVKTAIDNLQASIDAKPSPADAVYTVTASSTDGVAYTATVPGIDSLTAGASFIMVPNKTSASQEPTLNVNGLGAKKIRRRLNNLVTVTSKGYSNTWISINKPFSLIYDGTYWIVEGMEQPVGADIYGTVPMATSDANGNNIADTYATIAMLQSMLPKVTTINLVAGWGGNSSPYYQDVTLSCCTETSVVDLQPTPTQLASWQDEGLAFTTQSGNGTVRVYVAGGKPSNAISIQVKVQEVVEV